MLVLGSLDGRPAAPPSAGRLVTVRFGSKPSVDGGRRWLTHAEISQGAAALADGRSRVVGGLAPA